MMSIRSVHWGGDRVYYHDVRGELVSLPTTWTDVADVDPFVVMAAQPWPIGHRWPTRFVSWCWVSRNAGSLVRPRRA
jgi:hypothetical protein